MVAEAAEVTEEEEEVKEPLEALGAATAPTAAMEAAEDQGVWELSIGRPIAASTSRPQQGARARFRGTAETPG